MRTRMLVVCLATAAVALAQPKTFERRVEVFGEADAAAGPMMFHQEGVAVGETVQFISAEVGLPGRLVKGAPYSAEAVSESVQVLADGNRITRKTVSQVARDGEGRTRRHEKLAGIGPWAAEQAHEVIFLNDPVAKVNWVLEVNSKTARKMPLPSFEARPVEAGRLVMSHRTAEPGGPEMVQDVVVSHRSANAAGKTESLGKRNIEGVIADGTRTTTTIAAGEMGNERPIEIVSERWYSPELQTVVMTKRNDPRFGETSYRLTNIVRAEPPRALFEVPPDYQVKEIKGDVMFMKESKK